jgi:hypothetical protein
MLSQASDLLAVVIVDNKISTLQTTLRDGLEWVTLFCVGLHQTINLRLQSIQFLINL